MIISDEEQIESPPCSGKSTLLGHIADYIHKRYPDHILHLTATWPGMKKYPESKQVPYIPDRCINDTVDATDMIAARKRLVESLGKPPPSCTGMWILVDEAQLTYVDAILWKALYGATAQRKVWVIAAGSYGSHTGSSAHSPPSDILLRHRMNLFSDGTNACYLAFTKDDAVTYMKQVIGDDRQVEAYKGIIQHWASPWLDPLSQREGWEPGFHPGVVAGMTMLLFDKVHCCLSSYDLL